jgi:hypothetical protein
MKELRGVVLVLVGLLLVANLASGGPAALVLQIVSMAQSLTLDLQTVMLAVAVPALLVGGLIWLSPWHRELGVRIATGAVVVLIVAVLGPMALDWLRAILTANGGRLFGGRR